jgi:hypothetical protein
MIQGILAPIIVMFILNAVWAAQVSARTDRAVKIRIGVDFRVKDKIFPAGEYYIETVTRNGDNALAIRNVSGSINRIFMANHLYTGKNEPQKLVFERRGGNFFLTEIFLESGPWGLAMPPSKKNTGKIAVSSGKDRFELRL